MCSGSRSSSLEAFLPQLEAAGFSGASRVVSDAAAAQRKRARDAGAQAAIVANDRAVDDQ